MDEVINYGLVIAPRDPDAFVLGRANELPKVMLQNDGQWDNFLPIYEPQAEDFETCGCTVWGSQNAIEIYLKRITGIEPNYSERFNYILADITCPGADPHYVLESMRANGVINQSKLPMVATLQDFLMPKPMSVEYLLEGQKWPFVLQHEWVVQGVDANWIEKMKEALDYSPLCAAVHAWIEKNGFYIRPNGGIDTHWCVIYGYVEGEYWKCFDSYDHSTKKLAWDFGFTFVKRLYVQEAIEIIPKTYWFTDLWNKLSLFFRDLFKFNFNYEK